MEKETRKYNVCQDVNCHEKLLTYQEIELGKCQKHGGLYGDLPEE